MHKRRRRNQVLSKSNTEKKVLIKNGYYFILNIIIAIVPIIYDTLIFLFGKAWGLQIEDEFGKTINTPLGVFIKILVNAIVIVAIIWYNIASHHKGSTISKGELDRLIDEKEGIRAKNQLFSKILHSTKKICTSKYDTLISAIKSSEDRSLRSIKIVTDPNKQIKSIIENLLSCVANITNAEESSLRARVAFRLRNNEWTWVSGYASNGYFNIENLTKAKNSTFNSVTRNDSLRENFIFFNKKSVAVDNNKYVYEPIRDYEGETFEEKSAITDGSILAKSIFIGDSYTNAFAEMAIFIDTTDENFFVIDDTKENVRKVKNLFKNEIFSNFEERLKIELALLYIKNIKENGCK